MQSVFSIFHFILSSKHPSETVFLFIITSKRLYWFSRTTWANRWQNSTLHLSSSKGHVPCVVEYHFLSKTLEPISEPDRAAEYLRNTRRRDLQLMRCHQPCLNRFIMRVCFLTSFTRNLKLQLQSARSIHALEHFKSSCQLALIFLQAYESQITAWKEKTLCSSS